METELSHVAMGTELILDAKRAIFVPSVNCLIVSDIHFGKLSHFRKNGIPLPQGGEFDNLKRLEFLIDKYDISDLFIIGDLFHSEYNEMWRKWLEFIDSHPFLNVHLVGGNHDILPMELYEKSGMIIHELFELTEHIVLSHFPLKKEIHTEKYGICGHIHPGVKIRFNAAIRKTLPCFYEKENQMIIPSFGTFTGNSLLNKNGGQIYVTTEKFIFKLK